MIDGLVLFERFVLRARQWGVAGPRGDVGAAVIQIGGRSSRDLREPFDRRSE